MPDDTDWLVVGDFNLLRRSNDRNKLVSKIFYFNAGINSLSLVELPLKGMKFTWYNMQPLIPTLERLDWFFISNSWINHCPGTTISTPSRDTSDHVPCQHYY
jgi:endonuclease/exonuclease/phosphatase family metal-dependent hydrolase